MAVASEDEPSLLRSFVSDADSRFSACTLVPTRRQLVTGSHDGGILVWSTDLGRPRPLRLGSHRSVVTCVAASASGAYVATASTDTTVCVWGVQAAKQTPVALRMHYSPVRACDISSDERLIASGSDDKLVKLSSLPQRKFVASLAGHTNWVRTAVFSPSVALLASGSDDKTVRLWDVERQEGVITWYDCSDSVMRVCFDHQDNAVAACMRDSTINIWDTRSHVLRQHYGCAHGSSNIVQVAFHPRRDLLLSSSADKTVRIWDLRAGRLRSTIAGHKQPLIGCGWDLDGDRFFSCDSEVVHLWSVGGGQVAQKPGGAGRSLSTGALRGGRGLVEQHSGREALREIVNTGVEAWASKRPSSGPEEPSDPEAAGRLGFGEARRPHEASGVCASPPQRHAPAQHDETVSKGEQPPTQARQVDIAQPDMSETLARIAEGLVSQMGAISKALEGLESRLANTEAATREVCELAALRRRDRAAIAAVTAASGVGVPRGT